MANKGLIITVVIFCLIFAWIITFSILAIALQKPIFGKLSIIGPLGHKIHLASNGISLRSQAYHRLEKEGNITLYSSANPTPNPVRKSTSNPTPNQPPVTNGGYRYDNDIDPDF